MIIKIKVPSPGESIEEVEVSSFLVRDGESVKKGQIIAEIDSDKATLEIVAEENGIIKLMTKKGNKLKVGDTLCLIDTNTNHKNEKRKEDLQLRKNNKKTEKKASPSSISFLKEKNISLESIEGTGKRGMITKKDCINFLKTHEIESNENETFQKVHRKEKITHLSSLRRKIAERLVSVQNQTATLTTFNEIDMKEIFLIRKKYKKRFKEKHGVNLGFMSFFTMACVRSLKLYPDVNAMIDGNEKINFDYFDISIAIAGPRGLMVPIIRNADTLSFYEIEKKINELSHRVRNNKISIDEMTGGTFTITNGGVFGSMLSTPIINPPQSAILGMHKITERVVAINQSIHIRPIMYVALSYDHRLIDGKDSVNFLISIKESIENPIKFFMDGKEEYIHKKLDL
ncbi:2-oxoglutarate dehydrogenase complex dihydrolipoyllysine-residue succinyltransferase [Blattabacterium cuenoti]|uniref:2-oxoglutarate dehydrogenase complex dihydrolipoyllysine-residue succinyltransferase n=1 Tax=Blattabacterium cuenoti TaxID=1653831 RepID=UPI00163CC414|nr:2-oxoglutarate dehydrogenase complex dihydrolipoyllysine-residue succinyltransferase [Blattabacterium cuenoti]